jgi:hypothetical protein
MTEPCCGNCKHYAPTCNPETGRVLRSLPGKCEYPVVWPVLPAVYGGCGWKVTWPIASPCWSGSHSKCQLFEAQS